MAALTSVNRLKPIDWVKDADRLGTNFDDDYLLKSQNYTVDKLHQYHVDKRDAEAPGNFVATGNCGLNEATIYMIGSDRLLQPFDIEGNGLIVADKPGCDSKESFARRVRAIIHVTNRILCCLGGRGGKVAFFITNMKWFKKESAGELNVRRVIINLPVIKPLFDDEFNLTSCLNFEGIGINKTKLESAADWQFSEMQKSGLSSSVADGKIAIIISNPIVFPTITKAFPHAKLIQIASDGLNFKGAVGEMPLPPLGRLPLDREAETKVEQDGKKGAPLSTPLALPLKIDVSDIDCLKFFKKVDSSSSNIYRLKVPDVRNTLQWIRTTIFISQLKQPTIVLFPWSICLPNPADRFRLAKCFRNAVKTNGKEDVVCKRWRDCAVSHSGRVMRPRYGDNEGRNVLNYYANHFRGHAIVMVGPEACFPAKLEKRLKHFGFTDLEYLIT